MGRTILAVLLGLVVLGLTMSVMQMIGRELFPQPLIANDQFLHVAAEYMDRYPLGSKWMSVAAWILSTFFGAYVASLVSHKHHRGAALSVGIAMLLSVSALLYMIPHPLWMIAFAVLTPVPVALLAWKVQSRRAAAGHST